MDAFRAANRPSSRVVADIIETLEVIHKGRADAGISSTLTSIRPLALNRKNALFAGSDGGAAHWATIDSLIETCKLNGVDPQAYLAAVIDRIVAGHPQSRLDLSPSVPRP